MTIDDYLARIGWRGPVRADLETLTALHSAHLDAIPFENVDVQLGRPIRIDADSVFDKLVRRRRGGWCYEMNGLFGWALAQIGFDVMRMAGGVMRESAGDGQIGNHLCLRVTLDRPYLVDVGFGGSLRTPMPLAEGERSDAPYVVRLVRTDDGHWRFGEAAAEGPPFTFDVRDAPADEALIAAKCQWLQSDPASSFVQNLVLQRRQGDAHWTLRGRVLTRMAPDGVSRRQLDHAADLVATLRDVFGVDEPEAATLWPRVAARHAELFGA